MGFLDLFAILSFVLKNGGKITCRVKRMSCFSPVSVLIVFFSLIFDVRGYQRMIKFHFLWKFSNFCISTRENCQFFIKLSLFGPFLTHFWPKTPQKLTLELQKPSVPATLSRFYLKILIQVGFGDFLTSQEHNQIKFWPKNGQYLSWSSRNQ